MSFSGDLRAQFGDIDIYLFDQLLRGRITPPMRVVDAGCGAGRNLVYLLQSGCEVFAADSDPAAVARARDLAGKLAPRLPADHFRVEPIERMTFAEGFADVVISSAVLHFASDPEQFDQMVTGMWRLLKPGGMLFCRLASTIGIADRVTPLGNRRFILPDGSTRFLVDEGLLLDLTRRLGARLIDPLKTTVVQDQRSMTTWVVRKEGGAGNHD
jgi:tellurite methyltransferase